MLACNTPRKIDFSFAFRRTIVGRAIRNKGSCDESRCGPRRCRVARDLQLQSGVLANASALSGSRRSLVHLRFAIRERVPCSSVATDRACRTRPRDLLRTMFNPDTVIRYGPNRGFLSHSSNSVPRSLDRVELILIPNNKSGRVVNAMSHLRLF